MTFHWWRYWRLGRNFNSHPHEEDDRSGGWRTEHYFDFNSHPHEEDDIVALFLLMLWSYFNSHPHEEDDEWRVTSGERICISTHILTRRMTVNFPLSSSSNIISTHILTRRMTFKLLFVHDLPPIISTHILTRRMTSFNSSTVNWLPYFNSHPHEEDDLLPVPQSALHCNFNSHPHEEDDSNFKQK